MFVFVSFKPLYLNLLQIPKFLDTNFTVNTLNFKQRAWISRTADWQSQDSFLWAGTPIFPGNLSKLLYGTATFSGIALSDSYFEMSSEIPERVLT